MPIGTTRALLAGRYRTIERVGSGGMATVLLAEDERLGRKVAVKRLHAESPEDTARRFRREARLGASLNHPNLVAVYDIVTDEEGVLIVMEYVDGETLRDAIARGRLDPSRALEVLHGIAEGLDHAHSEGIVHRDVKPANVLLGSDGRVKLADLGIATAVEGTRITMSGTVLGTAAYMAPEQLEGQKPGPAADVYSLAVVAWETLSGRRAYEGKTPLEIAHRKSVDAPPALGEVWPEAPAAATEVLARAMGPDPRARPITATAFVDELERAFAQPAAEAPPLPATAPRRREPAPAYARHSAGRGRPSWVAPIVALLLVLAIGAAAVIALSRGGSDSASSSKPNQAAAKKSKRSGASKQRDQQQTPAPTAAAPADTPSQTPATPAQPSTGGYQVPQPTGNDPAAGARLNDQGKALSDAGRYSEAIPVLERAVQSFPAGSTDLRYAYALFNLGHALLKDGRAADAVPVLEERLKNPNQRSTVQQELDAARTAAQQG